MPAALAARRAEQPPPAHYGTRDVSPREPQHGCGKHNRSEPPDEIRQHWVHAEADRHARPVGKPLPQMDGDRRPTIYVQHQTSLRPAPMERGDSIRGRFSKCAADGLRADCGHWPIAATANPVGDCIGPELRQVSQCAPPASVCQLAMSFIAEPTDRLREERPEFHARTSRSARAIPSAAGGSCAATAYRSLNLLS